MEFQKYDVKEKKKEKKERKNEQRKTNKVAKLIKKLLDFLGQHKRKPEFPVVTRESRLNSRKTTMLSEESVQCSMRGGI